MQITLDPVVGATTVTVTATATTTRTVTVPTTTNISRSYRQVFTGSGCVYNEYTDFFVLAAPNFLDAQQQCACQCNRECLLLAVAAPASSSLPSCRIQANTNPLYREGLLQVFFHLLFAAVGAVWGGVRLHTVGAPQCHEVERSKREKVHPFSMTRIADEGCFLHSDNVPHSSSFVQCGVSFAAQGKAYKYMNNSLHRYIQGMDANASQSYRLGGQKDMNVTIWPHQRELRMVGTWDGTDIEGHWVPHAANECTAAVAGGPPRHGCFLRAIGDPACSRAGMGTAASASRLLQKCALSFPLSHTRLEVPTEAASELAIFMVL